MKKKFVAGLSALVVTMAFGMGVSADEQAQEDVSVTIQGGEFSLEVPEIDNFGTVELPEAPETFSTNFGGDFTVKDLRGTQEGYRVDVSATPFTDGENTMPTGSLSLDPVNEVNRVGEGSGDAPAISMESNEVIDDGVVTVLTASQGNGMGVFDFGFNEDALSLVVDPTTTVISDGETTYTSTLTWDLVSAP